MDKEELTSRLIRMIKELTDLTKLPKELFLGMKIGHLEILHSYLMPDPNKKIHILAEGIIDVELTPIICVKQNDGCDMKQLIGVFRTETGVSNVANIERYIEKLNGKNVRISAEILGGVEKGSGTDGNKRIDRIKTAL